MKKTVQVVMLPTNSSNYSKGDIIQLAENWLVIADYNNQYPKSSVNLYFTSNEEIKEGDWYYDKVADSDYKITKRSSSTGDYSRVVKVIATTDKSLNLPLIPQSFIEEYVKNDGEIKEVEIALYTDYNNVTVIAGYDNNFNKKQTLEEAAEELYPDYMEFSELYRKIFIAGAKWKGLNP